MSNSMKLNFDNVKNRLSIQICLFGMVGVVAATTQFLLVLLFVETMHARPLTANVIAFLFAFQVSFYGHRKWTFDHHNAQKTKPYRFFMVAIFCFFLNESLYAFFLNVCQIHYIPALFIVLLIVPPITFILSKLWAFKK